MKIVQVVADCNVGGAEMMLLTLCKQLKQRRTDIDITIIALFEIGALERDFVKEDIEIICLNSLHVSPIKRIMRLYTQIRRLSPDIVHTHLFAADRYGQVAAFLAGVPSRIATLHNAYEHWTLSDRMNIPVLNTCKTYTVSVFDHVANLWFRKGLSRKRNRVIYNAPSLVSDKTGDEKKENKKENVPKRIVCLGRLNPVKAHETVIQAARLLFERRKDFQVEIYGSDFDGRRKMLEDKSKVLGVEKYVAFKGHTEDTKSALVEAYIYVSASKFEGLSLADLEAMSCELPIIASDIPSHRELLGENEYGILFPVSDPTALALNIEKLLESEELHNHFSRQSYKRSKDFSIENMVSGYESLYDELSSRKK